MLAFGLLLAGCGSGSATATARVQGTLLAQDGQTWLVGKNLIVLPAGLAVGGGTAALGAELNVDGTWGPAGQLLASHVTVVQAAPPSPAPTAAPPEPPRPPAQPPARPKPHGGHEGD